MGHIFYSLILASLIFASSISQATEPVPLNDLLAPAPEQVPLKEFLLSQLMASEYDYAEKAHTGIVFHYGRVTFNPDTFTEPDIEALKAIIETGSFAYGDKIHNVHGVDWVFNSGVDRPRLFTTMYFKGFTHRSRTKVLSSYPNYRSETIYSYKRRDFPLIPEYVAKQEEKGMKEAQMITAQELDRVTESKIGSTPGVEMPKRLALPAPSCNKLF